MIAMNKFSISPKSGHLIDTLSLSLSLYLIDSIFKHFVHIRNTKAKINCSCAHAGQHVSSVVRRRDSINFLTTKVGAYMSLTPGQNHEDRFSAVVAQLKIVEINLKCMAVYLQVK